MKLSKFIAPVLDRFSREKKKSGSAVYCGPFESKNFIEKFYRIEII